jgi:hypothetical protein
MTKKYFSFMFLALSFMLFLGGCKVRKPYNDYSINDINQVSNINSNDAQMLRNTNPYYLKFKPIVGSRQDDAKVVVDMGKVLKVWIAPYKSKGTMIAAHDIYTWVQKPDFIVGEALPSKNTHSGLTNVTGKFPFVFNEGDIDTSKGFTNKALKKYVNNVYKAQASQEYVEDRATKADEKYGDLIKDYLNNKRVNSNGY